MPQPTLLADLALDSQLEAWIAAAPMPAVGVGSIDQAASRSLGQWLEAHPEISESCQAGLWLLAGDLGRSHTLSQDIASPEGSFWHGIMHRREGDYENAKYWFRRVGVHRVLALLSEEVSALRARDPQNVLPWPQLEDSHRVAVGLIDACRQRRSELLEEIAWLEWQLLFRYCWTEAQAG